MATPSYGDPFFYFQTNVLGFKATELGKISFCSTLATLLAIICYRIYFKSTSFKSIIITCTIMVFCFNSMSYLLTIRANIALGINDFWLCLVSTTLVTGLGEMVMMPMLALACQLCPKNLEGTVYSFFMSSLNFGGIMSGLNGSMLTSALGITGKNLNRLPTLIIVCNILSLPPLFFLWCIDHSYFHPDMDKKLEDERKPESTKSEKAENGGPDTEERKDKINVLVSNEKGKIEDNSPPVETSKETMYSNEETLPQKESNIVEDKK